MHLRLPSTLAAAILAAAVTGCSDSSPSSPSTNSSTTSSVTVPRPAQPASNATVRFADQPLALVVNNAVVTTASGTVYTFEVASDSSFSTMVQTKGNVSEGTSGQTSVRLDALAGGRDYYWRARATGGGTTGPFSAVYRFTMGPAVVVNTPAPLGPLSGTTAPPRPTFRVSNATRSGPTGAITYLFEVASSPAFTTLIVNATRPEGIGETIFIPPGDLPRATTLYWRATAIDASNGVSSTPSAAQAITIRPYSQAEEVAVQLGQALWTRVEPPGTVGHATMGNDPVFSAGWQVQTLYYAPRNVSFQSPDIEQLRIFDLLDRGFSPESAIAWMISNGYPTIAAWYPPPEKAVIGFQYVYIAARGKIVTNGTWDIVVRVE